MGFWELVRGDGVEIGVGVRVMGVVYEEGEEGVLDGLFGGGHDVRGEGNGFGEGL